MNEHNNRTERWVKKNPTPHGQSPCLFASSPSYSPIKAEENNGPQSERFTSLKRGGKKKQEKLWTGKTYPTNEQKVKERRKKEKKKSHITWAEKTPKNLGEATLLHVVSGGSLSPWPSGDGKWKPCTSPFLLTARQGARRVGVCVSLLVQSGGVVVGTRTLSLKAPCSLDSQHPVSWADSMKCNKSACNASRVGAKILQLCAVAVP